MGTVEGEIAPENTWKRADHVTRDVVGVFMWFCANASLISVYIMAQVRFLSSLLFPILHLLLPPAFPFPHRTLIPNIPITR